MAAVSTVLITGASGVAGRWCHGWWRRTRPRHAFTEFLFDPVRRDAAGEDLATLQAPGYLPG